MENFIFCAVLFPGHVTYNLQVLHIIILIFSLLARDKFRDKKSLKLTEVSICLISGNI